MAAEPAAPAPVPCGGTPQQQVTSSTAAWQLLALRLAHVRGLLVVSTAAAVAAAAPPRLLRQQLLSALHRQAMNQLPCKMLRKELRQGGQWAKRLLSQLKRTSASILTWRKRRSMMLKPMAVVAPCRYTEARNCLSMLILIQLTTLKS